MGYGYQKRDYEVIDYKLWLMDGIARPLRGPKPEKLREKNYFSSIGGAQTFGCYTEKPYPELLSEILGIEALNMGNAGAGPSFYLRQPKYIELINRSKFVIVQVMSGRSESNRIFNSIGGRGRLKRKSDGEVLMAERAYRWLLEKNSREKIDEILDQTRNNYVNNMKSLLSAIGVSRILFWFSERVPDYELVYDDVRGFFGKYPQLVNDKMIEELKPFADYYVESVSSAGMPQKLINRFNGEIPRVSKTHNKEPEIRKYNTYYPSPEMHKIATSKLLPFCRTLVAD